jgi:peptide/nickel transport system permease protein
MANLSASPAPATTQLPTTAAARTRARSRVWEFIRTQPLATAAAVVILAFVVMGIFAPLIAPFGPTEQIRTSIQHPPGGQFLFGTDDLGRDVFSRVLYGARTSLLISVATVVISGAIGTAIGVLSGYFGGRWLDSLLQRVMDAVIAVPGLVLLLFIAAVLGPSIRDTIIALTVLIVPAFNRVARGEMLRVREEPYVEAARANGASCRTCSHRWSS